MRLRELFETVRDKVTKKTSLDIDDLDFMMDHAEPTGQKIRGLEVWEGDPSEIQEDGEFMLLIKDPRRDGFVAGLEINRAPEGYHFTQVFMVPELQGKNIAIEMYKMAIKDFGFIIATDETQTKGAESIWQKLAKTPGIDVYAWNTAKDSFHHWDPDEDDTTNVYYDQDEIDELNKEKKEFRGELMKQLMNGEISKDDFKDQLQKKFHQIDSYIKSLIDVKTDKVLLVAKETEHQTISESDIEKFVSEKSVDLTEGATQDQVDEIVEFFDSNINTVSVGDTGYMAHILVYPIMNRIFIRKSNSESIVTEISNGVYSVEVNGKNIKSDTQSNMMQYREFTIFETNNELQKFVFMLSMKFSDIWNIEEVNV